MSEINIPQVTEQPSDLVFSSPEISRDELPYISRDIEGQSWSTIMAIGLLMEHENDLRDNNNLADMVSAGLSGVVDNSVSDDDLSVLYEDSVSRRSSIGLGPIDEDTYKKERDPRLLRNFAYDVILASGLEYELGDDILTAKQDNNIVSISDSSVGKATSPGSADKDIKSDAESIAVSLGLEVGTSDLQGKNLIIDNPLPIDSTDVYIKKVVANV